MLVQECDHATFKFQTFGGASQALYDFAQRQYQSTAGLLTHHTQQFFERAHQVVDQFKQSDMVRRTQAALRMVVHVADADVIRELYTIGEFQQATLTMRRWNMANPVVRKRWQEGACEGYGDAYYDMQPGTIGEDQYDYRRVMNGIITVTEGSDDFTATTYYDELVEDSDDLDIVEQAMILDTWERMNLLMKRSDDPTSALNASL